MAHRIVCVFSSAPAVNKAAGFVMLARSAGRRETAPKGVSRTIWPSKGSAREVLTKDSAEKGVSVGDRDPRGAPMPAAAMRKGDDANHHRGRSQSWRRGQWRESGSQAGGRRDDGRELSLALAQALARIVAMCLFPHPLLDQALEVGCDDPGLAARMTQGRLFVARRVDPNKRQGWLPVFFEWDRDCRSERTGDLAPLLVALEAL